MRVFFVQPVNDSKPPIEIKADFVRTIQINGRIAMLTFWAKKSFWRASRCVGAFDCPYYVNCWSAEETCDREFLKQAGVRS